MKSKEIATSVPTVVSKQSLCLNRKQISVFQDKRLMLDVGFSVFHYKLSQNSKMTFY